MEMHEGIYPPSMKFKITYDYVMGDNHKRRTHTVSVAGIGEADEVIFGIDVFEPPDTPLGMMHACVCVQLFKFIHMHVCACGPNCCNNCMGSRPDGCNGSTSWIKALLAIDYKSSHVPVIHKPQGKE